MANIQQPYAPTQADLNLALSQSTQDIFNLVSPIFYEPSLSDFQLLQVAGQFTIYYHLILKTNPNPSDPPRRGKPNVLH